MKTADFDFSLPKEFIAGRPSADRDGSRLLVLHRSGGVEHKKFADIPEYLKSGDMLLINDTKVFPARIIGTKPSGGKIDILLVRETTGNCTWEILCKNGFNGIVSVFDGVKAEIRSENSSGSLSKKKLIRFLDIAPLSLSDRLWRYGYMPLPPYIKRMPDEEDRDRYQTVYAARQGSIAAPTAGLHFTEELFFRIRDIGVKIRTLTLHVGSGTFKPVNAEFLSEHNMEPEYFEFNSSIMEEIGLVKKAGNRIFAVGTTTTRAVEGFMSGRYKDSDKLSPPQPPLIKGGGDSSTIKGCTDIFIYPGYEFKAVDSLITNFHLPRSTPLMLVSALAGFNKISKSYEEAIAMNYRFFSYGDAMLIL